ncbi:hypothetical protein [Dehalobacter sp. TeCB1]|nr:hypothetical protein [Dehalobacter sp. TeCB1]
MAKVIALANHKGVSEDDNCCQSFYRPCLPRQGDSAGGSRRTG